MQLAYTLEPTALEFCSDAELCMTFDRTALGLDPTDCNDLQFAHKDKICGADPDANCETDADCPPGISCVVAYHSHITNCECPGSSSVGTCCTNIDHFSDYILVSPVEEAFPTIYKWLLVLLILALIVCAIVCARRWRFSHTH